MLKSKSSLLAATIVAGLMGSPALAATTPFVPILTPLPAPGPNDGDNALHGAGASSVAKLIVREFNCIGLDHKLGNSGISGTNPGSFSTITAGKYTPASPTAANPALDCSVADSSASSTNIQPSFAAKYVSTGSGFGRQMWREYKDDFDGSSVGTGVNKVYNPFSTIGEVSGTTDQRWSHLQYAISDSPLSSSELTQYNNGGTSSTTGTFSGAAGSAGAAVQFPLFVLPVAVVYSPVYGVNAASAPMTFNAQWTTSFNGVSLNALRLSRQAYCGIFNGYYKNWNASVFQILNKNKPLYDQVNDTATRWATDGAPIRLAGRLDNSGTTNVFTRHLNAVCSDSASIPTVNSGKPGFKATALTTPDTTYVNAYARAADNLPYNSASNGGVDLSTVREDSNYKPANSGTTKVAGSTNLISGSYYDGTNLVTLAGTTSGAPSGSQGSGLFTTADGGSKLAKYILIAPDYTLNGVTLNGKIGYISADAIPPSPDAAAVPSGAPTGTFLASALLQVSNTAGYAQPSLVQALKAFGSGTTAILPPESDANGAYLAGDTRLVKNAAGSSVVAVRENPIAWTDVLYTDNGGNNLAAPLAGYPIVGTTQFFGYTCYTATNRQAIVEVLGLALGGVTSNSTNGAVSVNTFKGAAAANIGIFDQANIGVLPAAWQKALVDTFLQKSATTALAAKNLYIQDVVQLAKSTKAVPTPTSAGNPTCDGKTGA